MNEEKEYFDLRILKQFQDGDQAAFTKVYEFYKNHVYYLGLQYFHDEDKALDVVQNTFLTVYKDITKLKALEAFFVWLERIAYRCCLQISRKNNQDASAYVNKYDDDDDSNYLEEAFTYDNKVDNLTEIQQKDANKIILQTLHGMSDDWKLVGYLRFYEELDLKDIASILDVPIGTVMSRVGRIKKKLKEELEKHHFTKENCFGILVVPNMIHIYTEYTASMKGISESASSEILKQVKSEQAHEKKTMKKWYIAMTGLIVASVALPTGIAAYQALNNNRSILPSPAKFAIVEYSKELTNKPVLLYVKTTNESYDQILLNNKTELSVKKNGTYELKLLKNNEVLDTLAVEITNIDTDIPIVVDEKVDDNTITFTLKDEGSGVDFSTIEFYEDDIRSESYKMNQEEATIQIIRDVEKDSNLKIKDIAGNILEIKINSYKITG